MTTAQSNTEMAVATHRSSPYLAALDDFVNGSFTDRSLRPWAIGRHDLAYIVKAVHGISEKHHVPRAGVWDDLQENMLRVQKSVGWRLRSIPAGAYCMLRCAQYFATQQLYGRLWAGRYIPNLSDKWLESCPQWQSRSCPQAPLATIVVVSHNRNAYLRSTLHSLFQTVDPQDAEVIVVDNGSDDGSREFVRDLAEREWIDKAILCQSNHGIARGFNLGFAHANPESRNLIKLDSDIVILTENWLPRLNQFLETTGDVGAACMVEINHSLMTRLPRELMANEQVSSWNWGVCSGAGMTIPRSVFQRVGYFREEFDFTYSPCDFDMPLRMALLGYEKKFYVQQCHAFHRTDLDHSQYRRSEKHKSQQKSDRAKARQRLTRGYATGELNPAVHYEQYESCRVDDRVVETE